jgi:hypothetical protein
MSFRHRLIITLIVSVVCVLFMMFGDHFVGDRTTRVSLVRAFVTVYSTAYFMFVVLNEV